MGIAYKYKTGVIGSGNTQLIEILPARLAGTDKTYTLQVALDGKNFLEKPVATLQVLNNGITGETGFFPAGKEDIREIKVRYIDAATKKDIVEPEIFRGYEYHMISEYPIEKKELEGYELLSEPTIPKGDKDFIGAGREFVYEYKKIKTPDADNKEGWQIDGTGRWYRNADGSYPASAWKQIEGEWYYFDARGYAVKNQWLQDGGQWYYFENDNKAAKGWKAIGGVYYFFDKVNSNMKVGWVNDGGTWYYMAGSGAMQTGWVNDGGTWYYMAGSGAMQTGWVNAGGAWYYMASNGVMQTGWINDGGNWYYMAGSGAMMTGWLQQGNTWYYLTGSGAMAANATISVGGRNYRFAANGAWIG